jgi:hypothetical protein
MNIDYINQVIKGLVEALEATVEWIDAVPSNVRATLPTMPGFDYDWVQDTLGKGKSALVEVASTAPVDRNSVLEEAAELASEMNSHGQFIAEKIRELKEAASAAPAEMVSRKAYICKGCTVVYADEPVTRCDCMPTKQEWIEGTILYRSASAAPPAIAPSAASQ